MERCFFITILRRTKRSVRWSRTVRCLTFLLLQYALAAVGVGARTNTRLPPNLDRHSAGEAEPRPYLQVASSRAFRIKPELPPPDLSSKPAAGGAPPQPRLQVPVAQATASAPSRTETSTGLTGVPVAIPLSSSPAGATASAPELAQSELRPAGARPEDFLPFFRIPDHATIPGGEVPPVK